MSICITINNAAHEFSKVSTLQEILNHLAVQQSGIAVAVNNNIVTKTEWDKVTLKTSDAVLIITATQGG
jgi:sulfur carrier protein